MPYYQQINQTVREQLGGLHSMRIILGRRLTRAQDFDRCRVLHPRSS